MTTEQTEQASNRPELEYMIHPIINKPRKLKDMPLKLLKELVTEEEFESERLRRKAKREQEKGRVKNVLGKEKAGNIETTKTTIQSGLAVKKTVGGLFAIVDLTGVYPIMTAEEQAIMLGLASKNYDDAERYYKRLIADMWGDHIIYVTSNLKQAEDIIHGKIKLSDVNKFGGFASETDRQRVRKLIIKAGL